MKIKIIILVVGLIFAILNLTNLAGADPYYASDDVISSGKMPPAKPWTDEEMKNAKPYPMPEVPSSVETSGNNPQPTPPPGWVLWHGMYVPPDLQIGPDNMPEDINGDGIADGVIGISGQLIPFNRNTNSTSQPYLNDTATTVIALYNNNGGILPAQAADKFLTHGIAYLLAFINNPEYEKGNGSMRSFEFRLSDGTMVRLGWARVCDSSGCGFRLSLAIFNSDGTAQLTLLSDNEGNVDPNLVEQATKTIANLLDRSGMIVILGKGDKEQKLDLSTPEGMQAFFNALVSSICGNDPVPPLISEKPGSFSLDQNEKFIGNNKYIK